jgi:hypothetical protein
MKHLLFLLLFVPMAAFANGQGNPSLEAIAKALSAGDADALGRYLADNVAISIQDKEQNYNKARATEALRSFFGANKPKGFNQVHQGTSRENSDQYSIGNLSTANGNFRVYLYLKQAGSGLIIQEIRFDKE